MSMHAHSPGRPRTPRLVAMVTAMALAGLVTGTASAARPDDAGDHKITICHVTNSAEHPVVIIEVDVTAFDGEGHNDHTRHVSRDGRTDVEAADDGTCPDDPDDPDDPDGPGDPGDSD